MSLPNFTLLERIFEGEEIGDGIDYEEDSESLRELERKGLVEISREKHLGRQARITETGIKVVLGENRHDDKSTNQQLLIMVTSLYTMGTGGLILANLNFSDAILSGIGLLLVIMGTFAFFLIGFLPIIEQRYSA